MSITVAGTGHRPHKLGGYSEAVSRALVGLAQAALREQDAEHVISGMALGWDQALAHASVLEGMPFTAAIPFHGQDSKWPEASRKRYQRLLNRASGVHVCAGSYSPRAMQERNEWMVDNCDILLALWDGSAGGTANCLRYAESRQRVIVNLWDRWAATP